ncbi:hypothetical protein DL347_21095 [Pseudomonas fluorescens]|uniref:Uncharacterized protein n=1 Tax=Pseudomonas fluorescens TaxID=294 RepID=A0A7Z6MVI6_PSEFL|nr:hypothetical protein DL347_21095 [Pseudomonas fluorescens]
MLDMSVKPIIAKLGQFPLSVFVESTRFNMSEHMSKVESKGDLFRGCYFELFDNGSASGLIPI